MKSLPYLIASDLEGVYIPEIWINLALKTGIEELKLTTRDIQDYDVLMKGRLKILDQHNLKLKDIQDVINTLDPLPGAAEFLKEVRSKYQIIILSDTFYEFAAPLMKKLDFPTIFCHKLEVDSTDRIVNYHLRLDDGKRKAVEGFQSAGFNVIAMGDSFNDTSMLGAADTGILFNAPDNVIKKFPQFSTYTDYNKLKSFIDQTISKSN